MESIAKRPRLFQPDVIDLTLTDIIDLTLSPPQERKTMKEQTMTGDNTWGRPLSKFLQTNRDTIDDKDPIVYLERFYVMSLVTYKFNQYEDYAKVVLRVPYLDNDGNYMPGKQISFEGYSTLEFNTLIFRDVKSQSLYYALSQASLRIITYNNSRFPTLSKTNCDPNPIELVKRMIQEAEFANSSNKEYFKTICTCAGLRFDGLGYNQPYAAVQAAQLLLDHFEISSIGDRPVKWFEDMDSSDFRDMSACVQGRSVSEELVDARLRYTQCDIGGNISYSAAKDIFDANHFKSNSRSKSVDDSDF